MNHHRILFDKYLIIRTLLLQHSDFETVTDYFSRRQPRGLHPVGSLSAPPLENYRFYTPTLNVKRLWSMDHHRILFDKYLIIQIELHSDIETVADCFSRR